ncbi:hypothetical protein VFPPC_18686 [Pochonia chlamydosporia 170]|uniref:Uncharacterized protein n=1 Tax=Pochonia chlamydosporia 170 TaxID=1380566 RepID=A0A219AS87_METCM|nr:hypothetical protein VFPPC_18686 [Pochonia chlamydosporia 170]OWT43587.1 hypothetical protein VFPPC_18686 [Pochonia chlamydosporia 170]
MFILKPLCVLTLVASYVLYLLTSCNDDIRLSMNWCSYALLASIIVCAFRDHGVYTSCFVGVSKCLNRIATSIQSVFTQWRGLGSSSAVANNEAPSYCAKIIVGRESLNRASRK